MSRFTDEWQMAPQLWDAVRLVVDSRGEPGQFVLTGLSTSAVGGAHSGVGGIAPTVTRTMTFFESEDSSDRISLQRLFDGKEEVVDVTPLDIEDIARVLCCGGWPVAITAGVTLVLGHLARTYIEGLINSDVARMDGVSRNSTCMRAFMRVYARHVSTQASQMAIVTDLAVNDGAMTPDTISDYLSAPSRTHVVEDLPAWNLAPRFKTAIRTSSTYHSIDPSIGVAIVRWVPVDLPRDFEAFGLQFESLRVHDLWVYAGAIDGTLLHYWDKTELEADAIVVLVDGRWAPIGVKLGSRQFDEATIHLRLLRGHVDTSRMGKPSFLATVTAGATAYCRDDGVLVVPLAYLRS